MKKISSLIGIILLMFAVMSCGLMNRFTTGGVDNLQRTNDLWPDVPKIDGLEHSDLELPMTVKLMMRAALNNLWRLNKEGEDKTPLQGDYYNRAAGHCGRSARNHRERRDEYFPMSFSVGSVICSTS